MTVMLRSAGVLGGLARHGRWLAPSLFLFLIVLCGVSPVRAEAGAAGDVSVPTPLAEQESEDQRDRRTQSIALLAGARRLFRQGDFRAAIVLLERAYALTGESRYLFNLGAAHHGAGHCEVARGYYEQYLRAEPHGAGRADAFSALEVIYEECGRAPAPDVARKATGWSFLGVGAAAGLASATSAILMTKAQQDFRDMQQHDPSRHDELQARGKRYERLTLVFGAASGLLLASGASLLLLDTGEGSRVGLTAAGYPGIRFTTSF